MAAASVALGAVLAPSQLEAQAGTDRHAPQAQKAAMKAPSQDQQTQANLEVCCGAGVVMGGALLLMAARRGKKPEEQLLHEDMERAREWYRPDGSQRERQP